MPTSGWPARNTGKTQVSFKAYNSGPDENIEWIHSQVPRSGEPCQIPIPLRDAAVLRGKTMYQQFCMGCHGPIGTETVRSLLPAAHTPEFHYLEEGTWSQNKYIGGVFYYQITERDYGHCHAAFQKKILELEKIWDLAKLPRYFVPGLHRLKKRARRGIDAAYEPQWKNCLCSARDARPECRKPMDEPKSPPPTRSRGIRKRRNMTESDLHDFLDHGGHPAERELCPIFWFACRCGRTSYQRPAGATRRSGCSAVEHNFLLPG